MVAASNWHADSSLPKARISITGDCNLDCFFCKPLGNHSYKTGMKWSLMPSDAARFCRSLAEKGITKVEIAGCEPLLRKDAPSFVKSVSSIKAVKELSLKTNGTFLKNYVDALKKVGLKRLEITLTSLNFMKYQKITGRDNLYRVLDGLEKAERLKFSELVLNILVMSGINSDELIDFAMLTKTKNIHVRFFEYHPIETDPMSVEKLGMSILHIKRSIDSFQKLLPYDDGFDCGGIAKFKFIDGIGTVSFLNQSDIERLRAEPVVALNSIGELQSSGSPNKTVNILKDLRRDSKSEALSKLIDKNINSAIGKRKAHSKLKVKAKSHSKKARPSSLKKSRPKRRTLRASA